MSQYCTAASIKAPGVNDVDKTTWAVRASGIADSYIGNRYELPLISWGDDLTDATRAIARYKAMSDRGWRPDNPADETIVEEYRDAMRWLRDVGERKAHLVDAVDSTPARQEGAPLVSTEEPLGWAWATRCPSEEA